MTKAEQAKLLATAAALHNLTTTDLVDHKFYDDHVAIILPNHEKHLHNYTDLQAIIATQAEQTPVVAETQNLASLSPSQPNTTKRKRTNARKN